MTREEFMERLDPVVRQKIELESREYLLQPTTAAIGIGKVLARMKKILGPKSWKEWRLICGIPPEKAQTYMAVYAVAQQQGLPDKLVEALAANQIDIVTPSYINPYGKFTPAVQAFPWKGRIDKNSTYEECLTYVTELRSRYDDLMRDQIKRHREEARSRRERTQGRP